MSGAISQKDSSSTNIEKNIIKIKWNRIRRSNLLINLMRAFKELTYFNGEKMV